MIIQPKYKVKFDSPAATLIFCPKCFKYPKVETVEHLSGHYCKHCREWGEVKRVPYNWLILYLGWMKQLVRLRQSGE